jgi:hypothetical protein
MYRTQTWHQTARDNREERDYFLYELCMADHEKLAYTNDHNSTGLVMQKKSEYIFLSSKK